MVLAIKRISVDSSLAQIAPLSSNDINRLVLDHMTTAIVVFDHMSTVVDMNQSAEELLAVSLNQVRGLCVRSLFSESAVFAAALQRVLANDQAVTEREMYLGIHGLGVITVDCAITPIAAVGQNVVVLAELIALDRHKQITREERLVADTESARQVLRGLAHEIRNPLGGLRGAAQLLARELESDALREYTRVIVHEADRLHNLMDRMLGPRTPPRFRPMCIHEVTERVVALIRAEAPQNVQIERDYDPSIPDFIADPDLLIQAVLNVARNAVEAVGAQGQVRVLTRIHRQFTIGQRLHRLVARIDVHDDGPGIDEQLLQRVFHPLVTGRDSGTGLGLSIAQSLVNQHGGLIECESCPGRTVFSILLPVSQIDTSPT
jgi:two-component system nitrogen regulation sensor histidine kinase GlnL